MKVCKAEHGLVVPLPDDVAERLGISEGDDVEIVRVLRLPERTQEEIDASIERLRKHRGSLPADYKFNREELYDRRSDDAD